MLEPRFTVNKLDLVVRVSEFCNKKDSIRKYYNFSNTEFVNFALPSCIKIIVQSRQVLSSAAK